MEFVRKIIDSSLLDKIPLPKNLRNKKVEIIVLPLNETSDDLESQISIDDFTSILSKYKNLDLIHLEKDAWAKAMEDKYDTH